MENNLDESSQIYSSRRNARTRLYSLYRRGIEKADQHTVASGRQFELKIGAGKVAYEF